MKKSQSEVKNIKSEIKNSLEGINARLDEGETSNMQFRGQENSKHSSRTPKKRDRILF